jgi:N-methylhydantoinase A
MQAAEAVIRVANARMAGAIRLVSIERGHDPKRFAAMPFGGGGALHAGALVREIGLAAALVPRYPGVTSALGCVVADMRHDAVKTVNRVLDALDPRALEAEMRDLAEAGERMLARAGVAFSRLLRLYELDMLYVGQTHTVPVPLAPDGPLTREAIARAFAASYRAAFGRLLDGLPMRVMNLRVAAVGCRPKLDLRALAPSTDRTVADAVLGSRKVFAEGAWRDAAVYDRLGLPAGARIAGPALLEQPDATVFIDPGLAGAVDSYGNLVIREATP